MRVYLVNSSVYRETRGRRLLALASMCVLLTGLVTTTAAPAGASQTATTYYVNASVDAATYATDCASPTNADCGIDDAINAFNTEATGTDADSIVFAQSVPVFMVTNPTAIYNTSGATLTINGNGETSTAVSGGGTNRVFGVAGGTVTISNLAVQNGNNGFGGGIRNDGSLTVSKLAISGNSSYYGGGIANVGTLSVSDTTIEGNSASHIGGGLYSFGNLTVATSTIANNTADVGGGVGNVGTASVTSSTISGNTATTSGGGVYTNSGTLVTTSATVTGNAAPVGGNLQNLMGTLVMAATVVAAPGSGGSDCSGTITDGGYNIDSDGTCGLSAAGSVSNSSTLDASLGVLADHGGPTKTIELAPGSPAVGVIPANTSVMLNRVTVALCPTTDQRGHTSSATCDIGSIQSSGTTYFVNAAADKVGSYAIDCTNASNIDCGIDDAIAAFNADPAADSSDAIVFGSAPTFTVTNPTAINNTSGASLAITGNGATTTVVSGSGMDRVLTITRGVVTISKLTVKGGWVSGSGGGISNAGTLTISQSTISGNAATGNGGNGGGIFNMGTLTVSSSTFTGNSASFGGGAIANFDPSFSTRPSLTVETTSFDQNHADYTGGALYNAGLATIGDATFSANSATLQGGGGITNSYLLNLTNATLSGNTSSGGNGGALYNAYGTTTNVLTSTISGNPSAYCGEVCSYNATTSFYATIVANSGGAGCVEYSGGVVDGGYNIDSDGTCGFTSAGSISNSSTLDASLGTLADNGGPTKTILPSTTSPVVGAIPNPLFVACPTIDQRGVASQGNCSSGAVQVPISAITSISHYRGNATVGGTYTPAAMPATSRDSVVITVDASSTGCTLANGVVSFTAVGTCVIDYNDAGNATYAAAAQMQEVISVGQGVGTITATGTGGVWYAGGYHVGAANYVGSGTLSYNTVSGPCSVNATTGALTVTAAGNCVVTASISADTNYAAATSAPLTLTFTLAYQAIVVTSTPPTKPVVVGSTSYTPTAIASSGSAVAVSLDTSSTGCTLANGVVSFTAVGTCVIDHNAPGNDKYAAAAQVQEVFRVGQGVGTITATGAGGVWNAGGHQVGAANYVGSGSVSYHTVSGPCSVNATTGALTVTGAGDCVVTASISADTNYGAATSAPLTLNFTAASQAIVVTSIRPTNIVAVGSGPYTPAATASSGSAVAVSLDTSSSGCTLVNGVVSFTAVGICFINYNVPGNSNYLAAAQVQEAIGVQKATQAPLHLLSIKGVVGRSVALTISGGSGTGAVNFAVSNGTARGCRVAKGLLQATSAGTCRVVVTKSADAAFDMASSPTTTVTFVLPPTPSPVTLVVSGPSTSLSSANRQALTTLASRLLPEASVTITGYGPLGNQWSRLVKSFLIKKLSLRVTLVTVTSLTRSKVTVTTTAQ